MLRSWQHGHNICRQATRFRTEHQGIAGTVANLVKTSGGLAGKCEQSLRCDLREEILKRWIHLEIHKLAIIQPGAAHPGVINGKSQRFDQVQTRARIGAQADHIAGIGRNLRLVEDDMEHGRILAERLH